MKKHLIAMSVCFFLIVTAVYAICLNKDKQTERDTFVESNMVDINEIVQLSKDTSAEGAREYQIRLEKLKEKMIEQGQTGDEHLGMTIMYVGILCLFFIGVFLIYIKILRPFEKLKNYAGIIASGNLDAPLNYERTNYFGSFTWAFDHMRREIKKARTCEKQAIENNKTVIATLSHDIKTPIASIRAYAEGLDAGINKSLERRHKYIATIMRKCDEVTELTNDLFLHSISDLNKLVIHCEKLKFRPLFEKVMEEQKGAYFDVIVLGDIPAVQLEIDEKRFIQVIENIIGNSRKYAESKIEVHSFCRDNELVIRLRDFGSGIAEEDLPFVFDKFYRGNNVKNKQGAGLGLYIVKYVIEQMSGKVVLENSSPGLLVEILLPIFIS